jgi:hypothetical protein
MNRQMNLPALQRIAMEFEKENDIMDQRQEMMDDAIDDATGMEDEEESEDVVNQVLDEIGIDLGQAVGTSSLSETQSLTSHSSVRRQAVCKRTQYQKQGSRRQLEEELIRMTMTFRLVWTACGDEDGCSVLRVSRVLQCKAALWGVVNTSQR